MLVSLVSILSVDNLKLGVIFIGVVEKTSSGDAGDEGSIAEVFYNVKNGSSFTTSKSSSKNLSNENKHSLFFQNF